MLHKIKKEIGEWKDLHGLTVFVFARARMYASMFAMTFLVLERLFAIMDIDLGVSEYIKSTSTWVTLAFIVSGVFIGAVWMYVDLKFIVPSERRSSTKRDPIIKEIWEGIEDLRNRSELQQRTYALPLVEAIGKPSPKSSGRG